MSVVGTIVALLTADTTKFEQGMKKSELIASQSASNISNAFSKLGILEHINIDGVSGFASSIKSSVGGFASFAGAAGGGITAALSFIDIANRGSKATMGFAGAINAASAALLDYGKTPITDFNQTLEKSRKLTADIAQNLKDGAAAVAGMNPANQIRPADKRQNAINELINKSQHALDAAQVESFKAKDTGPGSFASKRTAELMANTSTLDWAVGNVTKASIAEQVKDEQERLQIETKARVAVARKALEQANQEDKDFSKQSNKRILGHLLSGGQSTLGSIGRAFGDFGKVGANIKLQGNAKIELNSPQLKLGSALSKNSREAANMIADLALPKQMQPVEKKLEEGNKIEKDNGKVLEAIRNGVDKWINNIAIAKF